MSSTDKKPAEDPKGASMGDTIAAAADMAPSSLAPYIKKLAPAVDGAAKVFNIVWPHVEKLWALIMQAWVMIQPYHPEEILPIVLGLVCSFFGGHFLTTIAAAEAFRMVGYDTTLSHLKALYHDYQVVKEASKEDDQEDLDGDGIADVKQITAKELATRKLALVMKSCDPNKVSHALAGIYSGCLAVVATLRIQFAATITLGATIGDVLCKTIERPLTPVLKGVIPEDYQKWIAPSLKYGCKSIGVSLAWTVQRVISAFHSAIRGGEMVTKHTIALLSKLKYIDSAHPVLQGSMVFTGVSTAIAMIGFYWQVSSAFNLPFPLNILLLPLRIFEWFLIWIVAVQ